VTAANAASHPAVRLVHVTRVYGEEAQRVTALDDVTLEVPAGQFVAVIGRSGSGKSTLLNLIAGVERPSAGEIWLDGRELSRLTDDDITRERRRSLGMIYQFFHLLPTLSVRENVALPALLAGAPRREALERADRLIDEVDLTARRDARPHHLSGGEMQRTAIARALVQGPRLLLADEPTGNLDSRSAGQVMELMIRISREHGTTLVLVTHSAEAAALAARVIELRDGRVVEDRIAAP
jgi:putative ABC transport system ATP-binding protein